MSIVLAQTLPSPPSVPIVLQVLLALVVLAGVPVSAVMLLRLGVFRPKSALGPPRIVHGDSVVVLFLVLVMLIVTYLMGLRVMARFLPEYPRAEHRLVLVDSLARVPATVVAVILLWQWGGSGVRMVGLTVGGIFRNLRAGLVAFALVMPWIMLMLVVLDQVIKRYFPNQPTQHLVFTLWGDAPTSFRVMAGLSVIIVASTAEELFFRGLIQTMLLRLYTRTKVGNLYPPDVPPPQAESAADQPLDAPAPADQPGGALPVIPYVTPFLILHPMPWRAIVTTSLLFMSVHAPISSWPPIFFLSLALGYVYERTGSLWAPITLHALFNASQVAIFLSLM